MIGQLTGTILYCKTNPIIIAVGGIGYEVHVPPSMFTNLANGSDITAYTYTHVREDALELFGFPTREDLDLFHLLITVSGVGPKTALLVIDRGSRVIKDAIIASDVDFFTIIPRLGKKNAQKIIIELKNKIGSITDLDLSGSTDSDTTQWIEALTTMGFAKSEIMKVHKSMQFDPGMKLEEKIRSSLKALAKVK